MMPVETEASELPFDEKSVWPELTFFLLCLVWIPTISTALFLLAHVPNWWVPTTVIASLLVFFVGMQLFRSLPARSRVWVPVVLAGALAGAALSSIFFYDTGTDGRWYHADAILALLHGLNPIYNQIPAVEPVYANHYAKAAWYFAAFVIHLFHSYQLGKIYNFLLIFACGAYALDFFRRHGLGAGDSYVFAVATALNPVAATQMLSYYVDGALSSLLTIMLLAITNILFRPARYDRWVFVLSVSLAASIKFTGLAYSCIAILLMFAVRGIVRWWSGVAAPRHAVRGDITYAALALFLGVGILGYSPYITNMQQGHHPMYPVLGRDRIDFMYVTTPPALLGHGYNSLEKFVISFFAPTQTFSGPQAGVKVPFSVSWAELKSLCVPDIRMAGWGVFFSGVTLGGLVLVLLGMIVHRRGRLGRNWLGRDWRRAAPFFCVLLFVFATSFSNPEVWWARYAPQIGLVPVFLLAAVVRFQSGFLRTYARLLSVILLANCALCAAGAVAASYIKSGRLNRSFAAVASTSGGGDYWAYRAPESKVHYEQFSEWKGIVICAQIDPVKPLPAGVGFPLALNERKMTEVTLVKGSCSLPAPY